MPKTCYKCLKKNSEDSLFCEKCGARLEIACPSCGAKSNGDKYCIHCGTLLAESRFSKINRGLKAIRHQSFNRQCSCGEVYKPRTKYCTKCGKRIFLTRMQKYKILMNTTIVILCIVLIPIVIHIAVWMNRSTVTDYDGNVYRTVKIGNQLWMNENLRVAHFNDGVAIANVTDRSFKDNTWPYYEDETSPYISGEHRHGYRYNWAAASDCEKPTDCNLTGICPEGWHLPSDDDFALLRESGKCLKTDYEQDETYWSSSGNQFSNQGEVSPENYHHCNFVRCVKDIN